MTGVDAKEPTGGAPQCVPCWVVFARVSPFTHFPYFIISCCCKVCSQSCSAWPQVLLRLRTLLSQARQGLAWITRTFSITSSPSNHTETAWCMSRSSHFDACIAQYGYGKRKKSITYSPTIRAPRIRNDAARSELAEALGRGLVLRNSQHVETNSF